MIRLRAISAGRATDAGHFRGTVHSVFERACNVALHDGRLLALLAPEHGNAPHAFRLDAPPEFAFDRVLHVGAPAACRGGVLRIGDGALVARLAGAPRWHADLDGLSADLGDPRVGTAWRTALRCLVRRARTAASPRRGLPRASETALRHALRAGKPDPAAAATGDLIGRGAGLTPAGDDLVVGVLAGLRASADLREMRLPTLAAMVAMVRAGAHRTNAISRAYLLHAARGAFAEPLAGLAIAIATGTGPDATERAARRALGVGATSGADGIRGLLLAFHHAARARPATAASTRRSKAGPTLASTKETTPDAVDRRADVGMTTGATASGSGASRYRVGVGR